MRIKALTYEADGNTVTYKNFDVKEFLPNVYITKPKGDRVHVIFKFGAAAIDIGTESIQNFENPKPETIEHIQGFYNGYIESLKKPNQFVRNISIELYRCLNLDTTILEKNRAEFLEWKEIEKKEREKAALERKKQYEIEQENIFQKQVAKFKAGEYIDSETFLEMCKRFGVKVHIRTIGAIRKRNIEMRIGSISGPRDYDYTQVFFLIDDLKDKLGLK